MVVADLKTSSICALSCLLSLPRGKLRRFINEGVEVSRRVCLTMVISGVGKHILGFVAGPNFGEEENGYESCSFFLVLWWRRLRWRLCEERRRGSICRSGSNLLWEKNNKTKKEKERAYVK